MFSIHIFYFIYKYTYKYFDRPVAKYNKYKFIFIYQTKIENIVGC